MATGKNVHTYFQGAEHDSDIAMMHTVDHGSWLGITEFDSTHCQIGPVMRRMREIHWDWTHS